MTKRSACLETVCSAPKISLKKLKTVLELAGDCKNDLKSKAMYQELRAAVDINTPMGPLLCDISLPLHGADPYKWTICNPFALLYTLCSSSIAFATLLVSVLKTQGERLAGHICLYSDESTHGNQQRHDSVNTLQCIYWCIPELPSWFRRRAQGWFYYGFLRLDTQKQIAGGLSAVLRHVLTHFYQPENFNFLKGVRLPRGPNGKLFNVVLDFKCFVQDEKAHASTNSVKGASGNFCCFDCQNIVNMSPEKIENHSYYHHYATALPCQFHPHTKESFYARVDAIADGAETLGITKFGELQTNLGITWNPHGLLMDMYLRRFLNYCPALHTCWDPMHCGPGSGGCSQYEAQGFCVECVRNGIPLESLDEFQQRIQWPRGAHHELPKRFFRHRLNANTQGHIRAFAGECLSAITALCWFFIIVLEPKNIMVEHGECMRHLQIIHDVLFSLGDKAVALADFLQAVLIVHQSLFLKVYDRKMAKIKFHLLMHASSKLKLLGVNLNCFKMERMHSLPQKLAEHVGSLPGGQHETYILRRTVAQQLQAYEEEDFEEYYLVNPKNQPELLDDLAMVVPHIGGSAQISNEMMCGDTGRLRKDHLVTMAAQAGQMRIGKAAFFASCTSLAQPGILHFMAYTKYVQVGPLEWEPCKGKLKLVSCRDVRLLLPYMFADGGRIIPFVPCREVREA